MLDDYGVPYGYTPVLLAHPEQVDAGDDELARLLAATARGYEFAAENPEEAASLLGQTAEGPGLDDREFLEASQRRIASAYCTGGIWGRMRGERWARFTEWLAEESQVRTLDGNRIGADEIDVGALYTNAFFD